MDDSFGLRDMPRWLTWFAVGFSWAVFAACGGAGRAALQPVDRSAGTLNDTAQVRFSDGDRFSDVEPATHPGQDGSFGRDAAAFTGKLAKVGDGAFGFDFTKLDAGGRDLPVEAKDWVCVRDNVTGLVWEVKTDDDGPRDKDRTYSYAQACALADTVNTGGGLCGYRDWHLPRREELRSIVHHGIAFPGPMIDTDFFPNTANFWYWTGEFFAGAAVKDGARALNFKSGRDDFNGIKAPTHVRLVHGDLPRACFRDNGDGTVTDHSSRLVWKKCSEGQNWIRGSGGCNGKADTYAWYNALQRAAVVNIDAAGENLGRHDWRLPNIKELSSITDLTRVTPTIDSSVFPATVSGEYWSSTPVGGLPSLAWGVSFCYTGIAYVNGINGRLYVRLVRDGP